MTYVTYVTESASHRPAPYSAAPATVKRGKDLGGQEAAQKLAEEASEIAACLSASPAVYPRSGATHFVFPSFFLVKRLWLAAKELARIICSLGGTASRAQSDVPGGWLFFIPLLFGIATDQGRAEPASSGAACMPCLPLPARTMMKKGHTDSPPPFRFTHHFCVLRIDLHFLSLWIAR